MPYRNELSPREKMDIVSILRDILNDLKSVGLERDSYRIMSIEKCIHTLERL
jgi:hypothetical protein